MPKTQMWFVMGAVTLPWVIACGDGAEADSSGGGAGGEGSPGSGSASGSGGSGNGAGTGGQGSGSPPPLEVGEGWPGAPNAYSWDGSWTPTESPDGLFDAIYNDGHDVEGSASPILPPGEWDWQGTALLANYNGFASTVGTFSLLEDNAKLAFGWRLLRATALGVEVDAVMEYYYGSSGTDIIDFGPEGSFASTGNPAYGPVVGLGDGPDMLRYLSGHSAAIRLGSTATGSAQDNDLALVGGNYLAPVDTYNVDTTTVHTGSGSDLVFVNNFERAAIDLGNGGDGRTDTLDPQDGADIVVIGGNARDFRVFGGRGNDTFVWYVDEVNVVKDSWLGPNFFGGGGWGDALWNDEGTDRLILGIPEDTPLVTQPGDVVPGSLLITIESSYEVVIDTPTENDVYARYYAYVPPSSDGRHTMTLQYVSANDKVDTAYFYLTAVEEVQIGVGDSAPVYALDDILGTFTLKNAPSRLSPIPSRAQYEGVMDTFLVK